MALASRVVRAGTLLPLLAVAALLLSACGSGDSSKGSKSKSSSEQAATSAPAMPKPKVVVPKGPAPTQLQVRDLKPGTGAVAAQGETLTVNYVGALYKNGKVFDTSFGRQPFQVPLGQGQVIPGWDQGLVGMKVGGRRELIIPPKLGYGAQGSPPKIPPNAPLVFVIDLLGIS